MNITEWRMAWGWLLSPAHGCLSVCHLFRECSNIVERKGLCLTQALSQALRRSCGGAAPVIHPHFRFPPAFLFPRLQCDCLPFLVVLAHPVANSLALWLAGVEATLGRHFANKDKPQITLSLSSGGREAFWPSALIFLHFGPGPQPEPFFFFHGFHASHVCPKVPEGVSCAYPKTKSVYPTMFMLRTTSTSGSQLAGGMLADSRLTVVGS
mmetsp:Transcript_78984/g.131868  ORF Transcript_78984/g.131868 Transcript_78984/m.131868 type:complete len:210 (+) Transcript_78984:2519-3148(+)